MSTAPAGSSAQLRSHRRQRFEPAPGPVGDPEPLERRGGAGEAADDRHRLVARPGRRPAPPAFGHVHHRAWLSRRGERHEELRGVAVAHPRQRLALCRRQLRRKPDPVDDARRHRDDAAVGFDHAIGGRAYAHPARAPLDLPRRLAERDGARQPGRQRQRQALVASGDARRRLVVDVREAGHVARRNLVGEARRRDLQAGEDRLARANGDRQRAEQLAGARPAVERRQCGGYRGHPVVELFRRRPEPTARLAAPVAHPLVPEAEPELGGKRLDLGVAGENELGPELDRRPVVEPARPRPAADAVASLEHVDVAAVAREHVGGGEAGEAGADHHRAHDRALSAGSGSARDASRGSPSSPAPSGRRLGPGRSPARARPGWPRRRARP